MIDPLFSNTTDTNNLLLMHHLRPITSPQKKTSDKENCNCQTSVVMLEMNHLTSDQILSNYNQRKDYKSDSSDSSNYWLTSRMLDRIPSSENMNMTTTQRIKINSINTNNEGRDDQEIDDSLD